MFTVFDPASPEIYFDRRGGDYVFWAYNVGSIFLSYIERQEGAILMTWMDSPNDGAVAVWCLNDAVEAHWFLRRFGGTKRYFPHSFEEDDPWEESHLFQGDWEQQWVDDFEETTWEALVGAQGFGSTGSEPMWQEGPRSRPKSRPRRCPSRSHRP